MVFIDEFLWYIFQIYSDIFRIFRGSVQVKKIMSKAENRAFGRESTLLIIVLTNSRDPVRVDTSKVTRMWPPVIVVRVLLG